MLYTRSEHSYNRHLFRYLYLIQEVAMGASSPVFTLSVNDNGMF